MSSYSSLIYSVIILIFAQAFTGSSLKCHVCNSLYNESCAVLSDNRYIKDCESINENPVKNYTLCRKEDFSVSSTKLKERSSRTIRSCGYEKHPKFSCFYNSNHDLKETICECEEDGCNGASRLVIFVQNLAVVAFGLYFTMVFT